MGDPAEALPRRARDREAAPQRLVLIARRVEDGRYLFVRWPDWPHPAMLALDPPHPDEGFAAGVASVLGARAGVRLHGEPQLSEERRPVRMHHPYSGGDTLGWLRPVAVEVQGEPFPDALVEQVLALTHDEVMRELPTDLERLLFTAGVELLEARAQAIS